LWFGLNNPTNPASEVRIIRCGTLNTPPHDQYYCAWFVDINGGWSNSGNLIAGGPMDLEEVPIPS